MTDILLIATLIAATACLLVLLFRRQVSYDRQFEALERNNQQLQGNLQQEFRNNREELARVNRDNQELVNRQLDRLGAGQKDALQSFQEQLKGLTDTLQKSLTDMRFEVNTNLKNIQDDNTKQLEKMRETVDEKLHKTLEERLGQSFELVTRQLEAVHKGLGDMQTLAAGVGDLKKVLSNVKTRGVMGEIQLGNLLEQILAPEQYGLNVATIPNSSNHVEFAIKFPGKDDDGKHIWLPIDSKFPMDRYEQVCAAYESGNTDDITRAHKDLLNTVKLMARDIRDKYMAPPHTTDFGILFLPVEGLYAEVVRHPGLLEELQRDYRIMVAGPTNLAAFLNSLQMGFKTLAIEKRSSEVWKILGAVKTEFGKFGDVLDKVQDKLHQASKTIDTAGVRTRAIERKLRGVEELPAGESQQLLGEFALNGSDETEGEDEA